MDNVVVAPQGCLHEDALWRNHWEWWCPWCGFGGSDPEYINDLTAHEPGQRREGT